MSNIFELLQLQLERQNMAKAIDAPDTASTEKSQIVIAYIEPAAGLVCRFSSVKKGTNEFLRLRKAWDKWRNRHNDDVNPLHDIPGDMFVSTIDVSTIACISFVEHTKREKFIPK